MKVEDYNKLFGIRESYELPDKLIKMLLDEQTKNNLFDEYLKYNEVDLSVDCLRDYFQQEHSARDTLKQDYTPDCLCDLMSRLSSGGDRIIDICSGTGALTIPMYYKNKNSYFQCEEFSNRSVPVLLFNLAIRNINAIIKNCDVLTKEVKHIYKLSSTDKYSTIQEIQSIEEEKFDVVISNPPYSISWNPKYDYRFEGYELAPKSKGDFAFLLDGLSRLNGSGKAFYILPHGVLFRGQAEGKIRQKLIENNLIEAVIGLPENLFLNTSIPVCIIALNKSKENRNILFIDASKLFVKKNKQSVMTEEHIQKIVAAYKNNSEIEKFSHIACYQELKDNDFNMNIPRYVDTSDKRENDARSCGEIIDEIIQIEKEYYDNIIEISKMIQELEGTTIEKQKEVEDMKIKYKVLETIKNESAWKNFSRSINKLYDDISKAQKTTIQLRELSTIERALKGKVYKRGCILLQISATDGQILYLDENKEIEAKYAVIIPNPDINSRYLFWSISVNLEDYLRKVQQGLNIVLEDVFKIPVVWYINPLIQDEIIAVMETINQMERNMIHELGSRKEEKQFYLNNMFVDADIKKDYSKCMNDKIEEKPAEIIEELKKEKKSKIQQMSLFDYVN